MRVVPMFIVCVCCSLFLSTFSSVAGDTYLLAKVLDSVQRGVEFFDQDHSRINVDGLFGLRVGQGQLLQAKKECDSSRTCPPYLQHALHELSDTTDQVATSALGYVWEQDPEYFEHFVWLINQPYMPEYKPRNLHHLDTVPAGSDAHYDEEAGDACFDRVLGTYQVGSEKVERCNVTSACWDMMTEPGRAQYSATHQLLFLILLKMTGCAKDVENKLEVNIQELEDQTCGSIYNEARSEVKDGDVAEIFQDLFLEQTLLCGSLGYENFLRRDWMKMVMRWQKTSGCFTMHDLDLLNMQQEVTTLQDKERKLIQAMQMKAKKIEEEYYHKTRSLLREKVLKDGCLSHKSGLGFGTVCVYLRFLVRQLCTDGYD